MWEENHNWLPVERGRLYSGTVLCWQKERWGTDVSQKNNGHTPAGPGKNLAEDLSLWWLYVNVLALSFLLYSTNVCSSSFFILLWSMEPRKPERVGIKGRVLKPGRHEFESCLCWFLEKCPWVSYLTRLSVNVDDGNLDWVPSLWEEFRAIYGKCPTDYRCPIVVGHETMFLDTRALQCLLSRKVQ